MEDKQRNEVSFSFFSAEDKIKAEKLAQQVGLKLNQWVKTIIYDKMNSF